MYTAFITKDNEFLANGLPPISKEKLNAPISIFQNAKGKPTKEPQIKILENFNYVTNLFIIVFYKEIARESASFILYSLLEVFQK